MTARETRSNSLKNETAKFLTLDDVRALMIEMKEEILQCVKIDFEKLHASLQSVNDRISNFENGLAFYKEVQERQNEEIETLKTTISCLERDTLSLKHDILQEMEERDVRRNNVMVFGLPEVYDATDIEDQKSFDKNALNEMFTHICMKDVEMLDTYRIGKSLKGKPRPIKVKLANREQKHQILRRSRSLRNSSTYQNVFINSDKTKLEQRQWLELRKELRARRAVGENVIISDGKIRSKGSENFRL